MTKTLIGAILADRSIKLQKVPELYLEFARRLQPHDIVITFNYDTLLERALDEVGKPYRLFPQRFNSVGEYGATVGDDRDEVVILKVHGSIDWFDRRGFEERKLAHKQQGAPPPSDIIFSHADELRLQPVVDGPRFDADPLRTVYRVGNLAALYNKTIMFLATPRMLPPSTAKMVYANQIGDFWDGMKAGGALNFGMTIIGFSMPAQDEYARQIMYSLATNYQGLHWDETVFGKKKTPLVLVKRSLLSSSIWPRPLPRQHLDLAVDHLEIALIGAPFVASDGTIIALGKHDASKEMPFSVSNSGMATLSFSTSSSNVSTPTASPGTSSLSAIQTLLSASQIAFTTTGPTIRTISLHFEEYS